jgi:hypothetical protein
MIPVLGVFAMTKLGYLLLLIASLLFGIHELREASRNERRK